MTFMRIHMPILYENKQTKQQTEIYNRLNSNVFIPRGDFAAGNFITAD